VDTQLIKELTFGQQKGQRILSVTLLAGNSNLNFGAFIQTLFWRQNPSDFIRNQPQYGVDFYFFLRENKFKEKAPAGLRPSLRLPPPYTSDGFARPTSPHTHTIT